MRRSNNKKAEKKDGTGVCNYIINTNNSKGK